MIESASLKIIISAKIENLEDLYSIQQGQIDADQVRAVMVDDAVVETGVTGLMIPARLIALIGLRPTRMQPTTRGATTPPHRRFEPVRLTIQGRECITEALEIPDDSPVLIGRIPLLALDWVVDPVRHRLIGNPDHGGEHVIEAY